MQTEKKQRSLKNHLFLVSLIPLIVLTVAIIYAAFFSVNQVLIDNVKNDLMRTAQITLDIYDKAYPGEYAIENMDSSTGEFDLLKGGVDIIDTNDILDEIKDIQDVDVSIYISNVRVLSTLMDVNGNRFIASVTKNNALAPSRVGADVYKGGAAMFYQDVKLGDDECCVYYEPIYNDDKSVIGMIGVAKKTAVIKAGVIGKMWPIALVAIAGALLFAVVIITSVSKVSRRLKGVESFIGKVAKGRFDNDIPKSVTEGNDEISSLASSGKEMQDALRKLVECDTLTGLNNRRYGNNKLTSIRESAEVTGMHFCLGICDIDHFKRVNDTYGHEAGDEVLKAVAEQLKVGMGGHGYVNRWGGEEFMVIFPNKEKDEAKKILDTIRENIQAMEVKYDDNVIKVTLSSGVTGWRSGESNDDTLKRADENLYYAKEHGRNQVIAE